MSRRTIGILIAIVGIAVAIIGVFSIRQILVTTLAPPPSPTQVGPIVEKVVIVTRDFGVGDLVKNDDVRLVDMPVELIPRNAVRDIENLIEKIIKVPLVTGEIVLDHHLADPTNVSHDIGSAK